MQMKFGRCMIQCEDNIKLSSLICYLHVTTNAFIKYRFMYKYGFDLDANLLFCLSTCKYKKYCNQYHAVVFRFDSLEQRKGMLSMSKTGAAKKKNGGCYERILLSELT